MTTFECADQTQQAINLGGVLTAVFPGTPFKRYIRACSPTCTVAGRVSIFIGSTADAARITGVVGTQTPNYAPQNPRPVPAGAPVYVQWLDASITTDKASAVLSCDGEM